MQDNVADLKICELKQKGLVEEVDQRSTKPTVVCNKCGAKANLPEQVHNPRPLKKSALDNFWG